MKYIKQIKKKSKVSILYDDDENDEFLVYCDGTVLEVNGYGTDEIGVYVSCSILYDDDDEIDEDVILYEDLFDKDEVYGWKLLDKPRCSFLHFINNQKSKLIHGAVGSLLTLAVLILKK